MEVDEKNKKIVLDPEEFSKVAYMRIDVLTNSLPHVDQLQHSGQGFGEGAYYSQRLRYQRLSG